MHCLSLAANGLVEIQCAVLVGEGGAAWVGRGEGLPSACPFVGTKEGAGWVGREGPGPPAAVAANKMSRTVCYTETSQANCQQSCSCIPTSDKLMHLNKTKQH